MHTNRIDWRNNPKKSSVIPLPDHLESVPIVYAYPGATENNLDGYIGKFLAVVVVSYGSGNVSIKMYTAIKKALENGLKVVLVTNCKYGGIYAEYGGIGGNQSLRDIGVIMADDLNAYQAMIVASLLFSNKNVSKETNLQNYFNNKILI
jgi:L-asparaginase